MLTPSPPPLRPEGDHYDDDDDDADDDDASGLRMEQVGLHNDSIKIGGSSMAHFTIH